VPAASCLNGPIGPGRRWAWTAASLNTVKEIRAEFGGTVNDVLLAAITRGFRDLLIARRELSDGLIVRSLVPISIRCAEEQAVTTNRLSAVLANLPVAESDPIRRLRLVSEQMDHIKRTHQAAGAQLLTQMLGAAPPTLLKMCARAAFQIPQPLVQTMTTNVPGPQFPLYVLGRQMVQVHPYTPIGDNVKVAVAIFSYLGQLSFGITADSSAAPDLDILARGIQRGLAELRPRPATVSRDNAPRKSSSRRSAGRRPLDGRGARGVRGQNSGQGSRAGPAAGARAEQAEPVTPRQPASLGAEPGQLTKAQGPDGQPQIDLLRIFTGHRVASEMP